MPNATPIVKDIPYSELIKGNKPPAIITDPPEEEGFPLATQKSFSATNLFSEGDTEFKQFPVTKITGWPEFKNEMEMRCITVFGKQMCTKMPQPYQRTSELEIIVQASYPKSSSVGNEIQKCIVAAVGAGVLATAVSGQLAVALAAFETSVKACLALAVKDAIKDVQIGLITNKTPGPWHPI